MENKKYEKNPDEIGVLWSKKTKTGSDYFSGVIDVSGYKMNIVIFKNNGKSEKAPTHIILKSKTMEEAKKVEIQKNEEVIPQVDTEEIDPADLPFN